MNTVARGPGSTGVGPRAFDPERFAELARARGLAWGQPFVYSRETGSTNDDALAAARSGAASGSVFLADHQSQGRGRRGKTWLAAPGQNLLFSILLRPEPGAASVSPLTLAVGLGVRAGLAAATPDLGTPLAIKWPNDVLAGDRKLAGILCEGQFEGARLGALVIGIGINVFASELPPDIAALSTSLEALTRAAAPEREALLVDVLAAVQARVDTFLDSGFGPLLPEFARHDALAHRSVEVSGPTALLGNARGVDTEGHLLVETDGLIVPVHSGTVRMR